MKNPKLAKDAEDLMSLWIREMRKILEDPEKRSASDFANALKFFKDHNIILDPLTPEPAQSIPGTPVAIEDLPSFLKEDYLLNKGS